MEQLDVSILGGSCNPWSTRARAVISSSILLVSLPETGNRASKDVLISSNSILGFAGLDSSDSDVPGSSV